MTTRDVLYGIFLLFLGGVLPAFVVTMALERSLKKLLARVTDDILGRRIIVLLLAIGLLVLMWLYSEFRHSIQ